MTHQLGRTYEASLVGVGRWPFCIKEALGSVISATAAPESAMAAPEAEAQVSQVVAVPLATSERPGSNAAPGAASSAATDSCCAMATDTD